LNVPLAEQDSINEVINVALRLWLMVNFRDHKHRGMAGGRPCIQREDGVSLKQCLAELFRVLISSTVKIAHRISLY
jgi:hypothetical protein